MSLCFTVDQIRRATVEITFDMRFPTDGESVRGCLLRVDSKVVLVAPSLLSDQIDPVMLAPMNEGTAKFELPLHLPVDAPAVVSDGLGFYIVGVDEEDIAVLAPLDITDEPDEFPNESSVVLECGALDGLQSAFHLSGARLADAGAPVLGEIAGKANAAYLVGVVNGNGTASRIDNVLAAARTAASR